MFGILIAMNRGYGFNAAHTLGFSGGFTGNEFRLITSLLSSGIQQTLSLIVPGVAETEEDDEETLVVELRRF